LALARPDILALTPYSSARMEARGGSVMLNANESPVAAVRSPGLNRYPDPQPSSLVERLAALYGVSREEVLVGRGSDEAIDLLVRAFCRAGHDAVMVCPPTFGMYAVSARIQGARVADAPLRSDFTLDVDALLQSLTPDVKLVFVCSPNNPTGGLVPLGELARLAGALDGRALLVVDEAYLEFAGSASASTLLARHDNVAVLRTLSKAHALAGARIGTLIARAEVVGLARRLQAPYPLPTPCIDVALAALEPAALAATSARIAASVRAREALATALLRSPFVRTVWPSSANFLCVRFEDGRATYRRLLDRGIVVRDVGAQPMLVNCLRVGIGTPEENARLL